MHVDQGKLHFIREAFEKVHETHAIWSSLAGWQRSDESLCLSLSQGSAAHVGMGGKHRLKARAL
jgi:hypothetical protein